MIRVAVIDDKIEICGHVEQYMSAFGKKYNQKIEVEPYTSSNAFLSAIKHGEVFDLIFLDIELDEQSGIDIANYIRYKMQDELQQIVYISGKSNYSLSLHDTHPLDFLIKPIEDRQLEKVMIRYLRISGLWTDVFSYQVGGDVLKIKISSIRYFSVRNKEIVMHTIRGKECFNGSLREVEEHLRKHNFLCIHRNYLVNPIYIQIFEYDQVILYGGETLPIGSSRRVEICKKRMEWQQCKEKDDRQ